MGLFKSKNITAANTTLTEWFNRYIRQRDANEKGIGECISCGVKVDISKGEGDAGHFIPAHILSTRWNEYNVNLQCKHCNLTANGMMYWHGKGIALKYGKEIPEELLKLSKEKVKLSKEDRMEMARYYKGLCNE